MMKFLIITLAILHHIPVVTSWSSGDKSDSLVTGITCPWTATRKYWRKQLPPWIIGDSNEPPGTDPFTQGPGFGDMAFTGPECKLGMWKMGVNNEKGRWDRASEKFFKKKPPNPPKYGCYPFSQKASNECFNVAQYGLTNEISSFAVTGYCECEFFDNDDCQGTMFNAFNRVDASLKTNGPHNDRINSVRCYETKKLEIFKMGTVKFYRENGKDIAYDEIGPDRPGWNPEGGFSGCRVFAPEVEAAGGPWKVKVNGVSCMFFDNYECRHPAKFWEGSAGMVERDGLEGQIKSYRCFVPWGIGYHERDDGIGPGPN